MSSRLTSLETHGPGRPTLEIVVQDPLHAACRELPASFEFSDEIYEFKNWSRAGVHALRSLQHHEDVFANDLYRSHLAGGIRWALGVAAGDDTPGNPTCLLGRRK